MDKYTRPDFHSCALIIIDTQRDTLDGQPLEIPGTSAVLSRIAALLAACRRRRVPIVHIVRIYRRDGANVDLCRRDAVERGAAMFLEDSSGCELAPGLLPEPFRLDCSKLLAGGIQEVGPDETVIYKPRWGAFYRTPLEAHLGRLGVNTLIFAGCNFPNCPRTSIYEAGERDFRLVLAADAISGLDPQGRREMINIGVAVMDTAELTGHLTGSAV